MYTIKLTENELILLSNVLLEVKDSNCGDREYIEPIMKLEQKLEKQTKGAYLTDWTYDVETDWRRYWDDITY